MPRIIQNRSRTPKRETHTRKKDFQCRLCNQYHPLRVCKKFLSLDALQRKHAVERFNYCKNCLAHEHSQSGCFSNSGCHKCRRKHHTLLHDSQNRAEKNIAMLTTGANCLSPQMVTILPTALLKISHGGRLHQIRALIDTGSAISRISKTIVSKLGIETSRTDSMLMCQVVIRANSDSHTRINTCFRVDSRIHMKTPIKSLPDTFKAKFFNLVLADPTFFESSPIAIVLGADIYPKIILGGVMPNHEGITIAQNSVFGWLISGNCPI